MKKHLFPSVILLVLLVTLLPVASGCTATRFATNATVYGTGESKLTEAARLADEAIAGLAKSTDIKVPVTSNSGTLTVGGDQASPPLEYLAYVLTVENGKEAKTLQMVGFEIDLCQAVAKKLGLQTTFVSKGWSSVASALTQGKIDVAVSAMATSADLEASLGASDTYLAADMAICTKTTSQLADATALPGKRVGVQAGSSAEAVVQALKGVSATDVKSYPHLLAAFADLEAGKLDAVVGELPVCQWILANNPAYTKDLVVSERPIETGQGYAFWCVKDNKQLLAAINAALKELRQAPASTQAATSTTAGATTTLGPTTTLGATTTSAGTAPAKSVYQLICEKWGLTGN